MNRLENQFGAELKLQFVNTLPEKEREVAIRQFCDLNVFEEMHDTNLFEMDTDTIVASIQMSVNAPSNVPTAKSIKTFIGKYHEWAKVNGHTAKGNPLAKVHAIELCSELAVSARFPKSIEALYELLSTEGIISSENGRWSMYFVTALLIYDGVPDVEIGELKMSDIDFEQKTVIAPSGMYELSDLTLKSIVDLHNLRVLNIIKTQIQYRVNVSASGYVLPREKTVFAPLTGKNLMRDLSRYKLRSKSLENATWCTIDSISTAGKFFRIYSGKEANDLPPHVMGKLYQLWKKIYYPED